MRLSSGAGHDAMVLARRIPAGHAVRPIDCRSQPRRQRGYPRRRHYCRRTGHGAGGRSPARAPRECDGLVDPVHSQCPSRDRRRRRGRRRRCGGRPDRGAPGRQRQGDGRHRHRCARPHAVCRLRRRARPHARPRPAAKGGFRQRQHGRRDRRRHHGDVHAQHQAADRRGGGFRSRPQRRRTRLLRRLCAAGGGSSGKSPGDGLALERGRGVVRDHAGRRPAGRGLCERRECFGRCWLMRPSLARESGSIAEIKRSSMPSLPSYARPAARISRPLPKAGRPRAKRLASLRLVQARRPTNARVIIRQVSTAQGFEIVAAAKTGAPEDASGSRSPRITCTSTSARSHGSVPMRRCCRRCAPPPTLPPRSKPLPPARSISSARIMRRTRSPRRTPPIRGRARAGRRDWTPSPPPRSISRRAGSSAIRRSRRSLAERPAQVFGLADRKGRIAVGADADLVLVDPDAPVARHARRHPLAGSALAVRGNGVARPAGIDRAPRRGYRRGRQACRTTAGRPISLPRARLRPERRSTSCAAFSTSSASCSRPITACSSRSSGRACRPTWRCTWRAFSCAAT